MANNELNASWGFAGNPGPRALTVQGVTGGNPIPISGANLTVGAVGIATGAVVGITGGITGTVGLTAGTVVGVTGGITGNVQGVTGGQPIIAQGVTVEVSVTPTVTASTYAVSKVIGGIMTFTAVLNNSFPSADYAGVLESITVKFKGSVQTVGFWVSIFHTSPAGTFTDTNTAAIAAGDTALLVGSYHLTTPFSLLGTHTIYNLPGIGQTIEQGTNGNLFVVVVPDATTASLGSTSDMTVTLGMLEG